MSRISSTYLKLKLFNDDINKQSKEHPTFQMFHKQKIQDFKNKNRVALQFLNTRTLEMVDKYVKRNAEGKPETNDGVYSYANEEDMKAHALEFDELMKRTLIIEY